MSDNVISTRWWDPDVTSDERVGPVMTEYVERLSQRQKLRHRMDRLHATLYADMPVRGLGPMAYTQLDEEPESARLNLCKAATDTWVAAIVKTTPSVMTLTEKGNWSLKRRAEGMNRWLEATSEQLGIPNDRGPFWARIAGVFGTCFAKVYEDVPGGDWSQAEVGVTTAFPHEITIDEAEAQDPANLRSLFHHKWYDVDVLCEMFPGKKSEIRDAPRRSDLDVIGGSTDAGANLIKVTEGWHLRSSRTAKDGYRAIVLPNVTLARVPYERDRFPFAACRRARAPMGLWGIGLPQELRGLQTSINEIMFAYEEAMIFFARPKWMVPRGSNVERGHLDDRSGSIVEFDGPVAPVMYVPNVTMPADTMQMLQMYWERGFEQPGINQILASGQIPAGLKSGDAIESYNDTGAARGIESIKLWEQFHVDLAELRIDSAREIAKHNPKYASTFQGKRAVELVYFAKVDIERDKYRLSVHPVSSLPSTPEGKLEYLDRLLQRGLIDLRTYRVILDWPDIERENALANAPYEIADKILGDIYDSDEGKEMDVATDPRNAPDPNWPLEYMRGRMQLAAAQAFLDGAPVLVLDAVNHYIDLIEALLKQAKPAQAPALPTPAAPPPPMGAGPMPPAMPPANGGPPLPGGAPPPALPAAA